MILRKPYAFLIKNFKLLHMILVVLMTYLLFRTNLMIEFVNEYSASANLVIGGQYTSTLFPVMLFISVILVILITIVLFAVMYTKKKPLVYYVFTIVSNVAVFVVYNIALGIARQMQTSLIDARLTRGIHDVLLIIFFVQLLNVILTFIRATGFDIKKFNFKEDLQELEISTADNEEFEFEIKLDTQSIINESKRRLRFMKYIYVENRLIIDGIILLILVGISYLVYLNLAVYNKYYKQGTYFDTQDFTLQITSAYLTNTGMDGKKINDNFFVLVKMNIRSKFEKDLYLNTGIMELEAKDQKFYHNLRLREKFSDIGNTYQNTVVPLQNEEEIMLIYEIPAELIKEKIYFRYINDLESTNKFKTKYLKTRLEIEDLTKANSAQKAEYNKDIKINNSIVKETTVNLSEVVVANSFTIDYEFCATATYCYNSKEVIRPNLNTNHGKALLRLKGTIQLDEALQNKSIKGMYTFLKAFAYIEYEYNNQVIREPLGAQIMSTKVSLTKTIFIEVDENVIKAEKAKLRIGVRNNVYEYVIK